MKQRSRGRPPKYSAEEVRLKLLQAARETLRRQGPGCGLDPITLDEAIAEADVPRGGAYRLWQHDVLTPQLAFRVAVQLDILRRVGMGAPAVAAKLKETYGEFEEYADSSDPEDREWAFRTVLRIVANESFEKLDESRNWRIYRALRSNVIAKANPREAAIEAVRRGEEAQIDAYAQLYDEVAEVFGVTIREPFTVREFAAAAFALNEGIASRVSGGFRRRGIPRKTGREGEEEAWTLFAIGLEALANQFFELDFSA
ncbi:MAG: hypothetical protein HKO87_07905 [Acidimicrobiia bacterium]|nr:hypothetical protein [Acidimicrobiia bacterium]